MYFWRWGCFSGKLFFKAPDAQDGAGDAGDGSAGKKDGKDHRSLSDVSGSVSVKIYPYGSIPEREAGPDIKGRGNEPFPGSLSGVCPCKDRGSIIGYHPLCAFVPLLTPVIVILAVLLYFQEMQKADERLKAKRDEIEAQLPRLVATIEQELKSGRNVVGMLERFRMNAGESLSGELDILIADMRSSNYEAALTRFESRINSPMLSDVVRGLIGVLRGDDSAVYFQMLSHDFKQIELQRLKAEAQKIPPKIRVFSFVMLMCFLLTYLTIICYVAIENLGGMF